MGGRDKYFPPFHCWCRCSYTIAVDDWDKWMDDYVEKNRPHKLGINGEKAIGENSTEVTAFDVETVKALAKSAGIHTIDISNLTTDEVITPFLKQLYNINKKHKQMFSRVEVVKMPAGDFAQVTPGFTLQLNSDYFNSLAETNKFFKKLIDNKFLPKGAGIEYSAIHEWGHYVSQQDLQNSKSPMHTLFRRTKEKDFVSKNSALDVYEFVADAIACKESGISCKYSDKVVKYYLE